MVKAYATLASAEGPVGIDVPILCIDCTFNIGNFYLVALTCQDLRFKKPPTVCVAFAIMFSETEPAYSGFIGHLVHKFPDLARARCICSDLAKVEDAAIAEHIPFKKGVSGFRAKCSRHVLEVIRRQAKKHDTTRVCFYTNLMYHRAREMDQEEFAIWDAKLCAGDIPGCHEGMSTWWKGSDTRKFFPNWISLRSLHEAGFPKRPDVACTTNSQEAWHNSFKYTARAMCACLKRGIRLDMFCGLIFTFYTSVGNRLLATLRGDIAEWDGLKTRDLIIPQDSENLSFTIPDHILNAIGHPDYLKRMYSKMLEAEQPSVFESLDALVLESKPVELSCSDTEDTQIFEPSQAMVDAGMANLPDTKPLNIGRQMDRQALHEMILQFDKTANVQHAMALVNGIIKARHEWMRNFESGKGDANVQVIHDKSNDAKQYTLIFAEDILGKQSVAGFGLHDTLVSPAGTFNVFISQTRTRCDCSKLLVREQQSPLCLHKAFVMYCFGLDASPLIQLYGVKQNKKMDQIVRAVAASRCSRDAERPGAKLGEKKRVRRQPDADNGPAEPSRPDQNEPAKKTRLTKTDYATTSRDEHIAELIAMVNQYGLHNTEQYPHVMANVQLPYEHREFGAAFIYMHNPMWKKRRCSACKNDILKDQARMERLYRVTQTNRHGVKKDSAWAKFKHVEVCCLSEYCIRTMEEGQLRVPAFFAITAETQLWLAHDFYALVNDRLNALIAKMGMQCVDVGPAVSQPATPNNDTPKSSAGSEAHEGICEVVGFRINTDDGNEIQTLLHWAAFPKTKCSYKNYLGLEFEWNVDHLDLTFGAAHDAGGGPMETAIVVKLGNAEKRPGVWYRTWAIERVEDRSINSVAINHESIYKGSRPQHLGPIVLNLITLECNFEDSVLEWTLYGYDVETPRSTPN